MTEGVCIVDLHQLCQDLFNSYLAFVRFQAESILDTGILQPSELTQSYLDSMSGQTPATHRKA